MNSTTRRQPYYYTDSCFQVEMNLHQTRLELIDMLDLDDDRCLACNSFKCCCRPESDSTGFSCESDLGFDSTYDFNNTTNTAPPACSLPVPDWDDHIVPSISKTDDHKQKEVEAWLKSVKTDQAESYVAKQNRDTVKKPDMSDTTWSVEEQGTVYGAIGEPAPAKSIVAFFTRFKQMQASPRVNPNSRLNTASLLVNLISNDCLMNPAPPSSSLNSISSSVTHSPPRVSLQNIIPPLVGTPLLPPLSNVVPHHQTLLAMSPPNVVPSYLCQNNVVPFGQTPMLTSGAPAYISHTAPMTLPLNNILTNVYL